MIESVPGTCRTIQQLG